MEGLIYQAICKETGKCYIGQTLNTFKKRQRRHLYKAKTFKRKWNNNKFVLALRNYGEDNFEWKILEKMETKTRQELLQKMHEREIYYIEKFNAINDGFNTVYGNPSISKK